MLKTICATGALIASFAANAAETITVYPTSNGADSNGQAFLIEENNLAVGRLTSFLFEEELYGGPTVGTTYANVVAGSVFTNPDWQASVVNKPSLVVDVNGKTVQGYAGTVHATWAHYVVDGTYVLYTASSGGRGGAHVALLWHTLTVTIN